MPINICNSITNNPKIRIKFILNLLTKGTSSMKIKCFICMIAILSIILCGCNGQKVSVNTQDVSQSENTPDVKVNTEVTLGSCPLTDMGKADYILALRMYKGEYHEQYLPGSDSGPNWTGNFKLCIIDTLQDRVIESYPINEELTFKKQIGITLKDYNKDGNFDFLIGQYASSNFNIYKMYYITKDFKIGYYNNIGEISVSSKSYSPELEEDDKGNLVYAFYDNSSGKTITKTIDLKMLNIKK